MICRLKWKSGWKIISSIQSYTKFSLNHNDNNINIIIHYSLWESSRQRKLKIKVYVMLDSILARFHVDVQPIQDIEMKWWNYVEMSFEKFAILSMICVKSYEKASVFTWHMVKLINLVAYCNLCRLYAWREFRLDWRNRA